MPKDREYRPRLADDAVIAVTRSSSHPVRYAIMLLVQRDGAWHTVRTLDNAHDVQEHHEHRYTGAQKQPPTIVQGSVNEAMSAAVDTTFELFQRAVLDDDDRGYPNGTEFVPGDLTNVDDVVWRNLHRPVADMRQPLPC